ncbi:MAG: MBOAT family protein [Clostridia bacterium]|nr:MBOAT family protein [Clostridia bacterium]
MVFSSLVFLFAFLPLTLALYFAAPRRGRNAVLFALSLLFYGWGEPIYILLMLFEMTVAYALGFPIAKYRTQAPRRARAAMLLSVCISLSLLFFFKYYQFFALNLSRLPYVALPTIKGLVLPIGISFYTFQIISYSIDLYRGDCALQRNYIAFGTYVALFPQLIAGPILRYHDVDVQLTQRTETFEGFSHGVVRFVTGLGKKVLIGDTLAAGYVYFHALADISPTVLGGWLAAVLYSLHLYYDFSGYSDMAIGLGRMFGFHFPENFNYPYISESITEFWRRWHVSLSTWFREYIYIPLGGNRRGRLKQYRNLAIVWLLTGFWHGANWNFLLWGAYFAVLLILEKAFLLRFLARTPRVFRHTYAVFLILVGFVIFSNVDLALALRHIGSLVGVGVVGVASATVRYQTLRVLPLLLIAIIGATPIPRTLWGRLCEKHPRLAACALPFCAAVMLFSVSYLVDSAFSPFEYTQF